jgi:hypothetical protein
MGSGLLVSKAGASLAVPLDWERIAHAVAATGRLDSETLVDSNAYTDAAHCYTLAASASNEADAFDLWACALTRHAFVSLFVVGGAGVHHRDDAVLPYASW